MNLAVRPLQHPFLDGQLERMLIDGAWVEAASGETFDSINPSTGQPIVCRSRARSRRRSISRSRGERA